MTQLVELIGLPQASAWLPIAAFAVLAVVMFAAGRCALWLSQPKSSRLRRPLAFGRLTAPLASLLPMAAATWEAVQREVRQAGRYHHQAAHEFLAIRNVVCLGWTVACLCLMIFSVQPVNDPSLHIGAAGVVGLIILYSAPRFYLKSLAAARVARIQRQLPDGLDMITMCMTGGLALGRALERVGEELKSTHSDLSMELDIIRRQADAHSLEHALEQFAQRIDVAEIQTLAALVAQTERLGSNVAVALREFADGVRRSFRQRAEERGNRTSVQIMLPVALCLAPPVYILLLAPAVLEMRNFVVQENAEGGVLQSEGVGELTRQVEPLDR